MITPEEAEANVIKEYEETIDNNPLSGNFHIYRNWLQRRGISVNSHILKKVLEKYSSSGWYAYETVSYGGTHMLHFEKNVDGKNPVRPPYNYFYTCASFAFLSFVIYVISNAVFSFWTPQ